jgi:hypothetical protein
MPQQACKRLLQGVEGQQGERGAAVAACTDHATVAHEPGEWRQALSPSVPSNRAHDAPHAALCGEVLRGARVRIGAGCCHGASLFLGPVHRSQAERPVNLRHESYRAA